FEEFLTELSGIRGVNIYNEMSNNCPTVGAILFAIDMLIRQVPWNVNKVSDEPNDIAAAEFLESCLNDMSMTWKDTISEILSMLTFGWAYHEVVNKIRLGKNHKFPNRSSKFNDGRVGWAKIPIRSQDTLLNWEYSDSGDLLGMHQLAPPTFKQTFIPVDRALLFRTQVKKNNPEGRSVLRNAYRPWFFKKNIENIEGIGIERDLAGLPVIKVPVELLATNASADKKALLAVFVKLVQKIRRNENEGVVFPLAFDENGNELYKLELLSTGGKRNFDTNEIVNRFKQDIAMTVLADFILLGHKGVGSYALASSKTKLFATAIGTWVDVIQDVFNKTAIPRLFDFPANDFGVEKLPQLMHG
ncbi:unnamed protein product, partial [marine sediment metagenome]